MLQRSTQSSVNLTTALTECLQNFAGRLPLYGEIRSGFLNYPATVSNLVEWVADVGGDATGTVIKANGDPGIAAVTATNPFRCWIPTGSL